MGATGHGPTHSGSTYRSPNRVCDFSPGHVLKAPPKPYSDDGLYIAKYSLFQASFVWKQFHLEALSQLSGEVLRCPQNRAEPRRLCFVAQLFKTNRPDLSLGLFPFLGSHVERCSVEVSRGPKGDSLALLGPTGAGE